MPADLDSTGRQCYSNDVTSRRGGNVPAANPRTARSDAHSPLTIALILLKQEERPCPAQRPATRGSTHRDSSCSAFFRHLLWLSRLGRSISTSTRTGTGSTHRPTSWTPETRCLWTSGSIQGPIVMARRASAALPALPPTSSFFEPLVDR